MNKQREALQVVLEALEDYQANGAPFFKCDSAVLAIREALAEPEQEPVAVVTSQTGDPTITMSWNHEPALPIGTKLYAAPPARKPLSDERIDQIIASNVTITDPHLLGAVYMAIREVEAAHGIAES